jgi:xylulokinase
VDTRASTEIDELNEAIGEEAIFEFSKMALSSQAVGPKIVWLRKHEPEVWNKTAHITTASSYIIYRLTGEKVMDRHTASHYMPLMDGKSMSWSDRFAEGVIDLEKLPRLGWSNEKAGEVSPGAAAQTGLRPGTPVAVGAVDALSEAISVGVVAHGDLMIMYGSTAFFILVQDTLTPDPRMWTVSGAYDGQFNLAAGMATTGSLTRWFRDELARDVTAEDGYKALFESVLSVERGSGGLLMLPYFSGERTPINDPHARGVIAGLSLSHTRDHMFRAVLEGVAYGIRHNIETFRAIGSPVKRIVAVGGGAKSQTWLQIVSDVTNIHQVVPQVTIGASYGDAFLAGLAAGILTKSDIRLWVSADREISPSADGRAIYDPLYAGYLELYTATRDIVHKLGQLR